MQTKNVEKKIITNRRKEIVKQLHAEGWSCGDIAQMVRLERTYIWRVVRGKK